MLRVLVIVIQITTYNQMAPVLCLQAFLFPSRFCILDATAQGVVFYLSTTVLLSNTEVLVLELRYEEKLTTIIIC
jgi:hypothetical protein